ncbi:hypothetical protein Tco_1222584, partial [Tanacetum coccineum]
MKGKGDSCIFVGYVTQSKGYRVYNKRTRLIVETIHINFDELKHMTFEQNSSKLVAEVVPSADKKYTFSLQKLDLMFSPMYEEFFNGGNQGVSKSFALSNNHHKDTSSQLNVQPTSEASTPATNNNVEENNNDQAVDAQFDANEFINPFATPITEAA